MKAYFRVLFITYLLLATSWVRVSKNVLYYCLKACFVTCLGSIKD